MDQINRSRFLKTLAISGMGMGIVKDPLNAEETTKSFSCFSKNQNDVPWLDEVRRCDIPSSSSDVPELQPLLTDDRGRQIKSLSAWNERRAAIRKRWLDFLGPLKPNSKSPKLKVLKEDRPTGVVRQLVEYEGEPGIKVQGYLIKPRHTDEPRPGVLALHSTTDNTIRQPAGVEGAPEKAFGLKLAQLGCVTFSPMNFLWYDKGERTYQEQAQRFKARHPGSTGIAKMLFDASRGLDVLQSLNEVDSKRLGAVGHSLGGKEVLYLAAFDERVRVSVSSEGGIGTKFSNWEDLWYLGETIHTFSHEHHELLALIAPKPFLLVGGNAADGEQSCSFIEAALPVYDLYDSPRRMGLLNHRQGHSMPPVAELRSYQWLLTYL